MGVAIRYIPAQHALLASLPPMHEQLCEKYYDISREALNRYRMESRSLSLELVELLLVLSDLARMACSYDRSHWMAAFYEHK